jgi:hypothetical protein
MTTPFRLALMAALCVTAHLAAHALDGPTEFTLDLPFGANEATPLWLGHPVTPAGTFATLDLPITPPDATASLLVTVFYQETTGGFLRISWQGASVPPATDGELPGPGEVGASAVLCENFYEGIGMSNQRSLLVPADTLRQGGTLHFQTGASDLGISRIKLEWLENATGLTSPAISDVVVTSANGKSQMAADLAGLPPTAADPAWKGQIVEVPITDVPVRVEEGVDFTVHTDGAPALARIALKEAGLPWGQHLVVWINNQRAGVIQPATPALADPGYAGIAAPYVGWREGTFFVPTGALTAGDNVLQVSAEPDDAVQAPADAKSTPAAPLALKDLSLELEYPAAPPVATPAPSATTTPPPATTTDTDASIPTPSTPPADATTTTP